MLPRLMLRLTLLAGSALCLVTGPAGAEVSLGPPGAGGLQVTVQDDGALRCVLRGQVLVAETALAGCQPAGPAQVSATPDGGAVVVRELVQADSGARCTLAERLIPGPAGLGWELALEGQGAPWTAPVETRLKLADPAPARFWTAWGSPRPGTPGWTDPLQIIPLTDQTYRYGGVDFARPDSVSIPLATLLWPDAGAGLTVALSPEDLSLETDLITSAAGEVVFARRYYRLAAGLTQRFRLDLVAHGADWREGLGWMARRYPAYFDPPNPQADETSGCGTYSSWEGALDVRRYTRMAYALNWKASFDFPYMGMFLPPVDAATPWKRFGPGETSLEQMAADARRMRERGFGVLNYFNVTEFGANVKWPPPPRSEAADADLWRNANDFLYYAIPGALLTNDAGQPYGSWEWAMATDCGDPAYREFLLEQARRHLEAIPDATGICIDRLDWLRLFNPHADDGLSWVNGHPARALVSSWRELMARLGPLMHDSGKVIYCNPLDRRLSLMDQVDGIYDEMGSQPHSLNLCALLGVRKPVMEWTGNTSDLRPDPDAVFQRSLYMGVFPTVPVVGNDHTIIPDPWADPYYLDYGPLLDALRGRKWVLGPQPVEVAGQVARANVFAVPGGYVAPVVMGGAAPEATVTLRGLDLAEAAHALWVEVLHPGESRWQAVAARRTPGGLQANVPLVRGCAMLRLQHTWLSPDERCFDGAVQVSGATRIPGACLRYTLDGSAPTPRSPELDGPVTLRETTTVRAAAFRGARQVGAILARTYVPAPLSAPAITCPRRVFTVSATVTLALPWPGVEGEIRYTTDGTEPGPASAHYDGPLTLSQDTTVKARLVDPATGEGGCVAEMAVWRIPPLPPDPEVFISDLPALKATVGWGGSAKTDKSIENRTLTVAGRTWGKGMGMSAYAELVYDLKPEWRRFVAVVGIDDEMRDWDLGSVEYRVVVDGKLLAQTPVLRQNDYWCLDVPLPPGGRQITLVAGEAGDGINCDHADWANAGFLTH
jgi:hypothetical protein